MTSGTADGGPPDLALHEERLVVSTERVAVERVRISKRIVNTTRTIEVPVRLEQLVISRQEVDPAVRVDSEVPVEEELVIVLREEVPTVSLQVVPVEQVVVRRRTVLEEDVVRADLVREHAAVVVTRPTGRPDGDR